ncbi:uncharacterized protein MONOS_17957 [Monocercomonoides exilis]|uniref:uncharacterized protein n=1 Tax=Monocercomonoides exilis TaxID=2049356 RepID=UPI00355A5305|nr:hypothetical protein MONOS_17957 [Monocercomonoides exilis]
MVKSFIQIPRIDIVKRIQRKMLREAAQSWGKQRKAGGSWGKLGKLGEAGGSWGSWGSWGKLGEAGGSWGKLGEAGGSWGKQYKMI